MGATVRMLFASRRFTLSLALLLAVVALGLLGPLVSSRDPLLMSGGMFEAPSREHWLGTDNFGRDVFTQLLYGTRTSLYVGAIAGLVATAIGVAVGALAGYRGGWLDEMLMGLTNVFITIPSIVILILVSVSLRTRTATIMGLVIGLTSWPWTARAVRAQTTSLKTREHMDVARLSGLSTPRIILFEILPFMFSYIFMAFILQFFGGLMSEATLSMLGLGPFQTVSLGVMLQWALLWEAVRVGAWWAFLPPVFFLTVTSFSLMSLNASMDEFFNPRARDRSARAGARAVARLREVAPHAEAGDEPALDALLACWQLHAAYVSPGLPPVWAVNGVSLAVRPGEVLGIAGESGCGKTTLAHLLACHLEPPLYLLKGQIRVAGRDPLTLSPERLRREVRGELVAMLPQGALNALNPTRRVGALAVDVVREHHPELTRREVLDQARRRFEHLGLPAAVLDQYPHQLSGGMKQRVVAVLSTLLNPRVLIADEPTSALDVTSQRAVLDLLRRLLEEGIIQSVVFITHELPLLQQVADRIAVMYAGRLVETGRVKEVLAGPQHPYTQALVRSVLAPEPRRGRARVEGIPGVPPDLRELPQGCAFAPRCGVALDRCRVEVPPRFRSGDRDAWCWRLLEEGWLPAPVAGRRGLPPGDG